MEILELCETTRAHEIDAELRNKWRNDWLDETDNNDRPFRMWLRKCVEPGAAWCNLCGRKIVYKSNGKKSITSHSIKTAHVERLNALKHASTLPAASPVVAPLSKVDSLVDAKIRTCAFLAEHCLPLSLAPDLVAFCQKLATNTQSLERLAMCRKTATYTMTHGVAVAFREKLFLKLRKTYFSLNIDEATNNANCKVVNVLVRYFDDVKGAVITQLLGSFSENIATSQNIFAGLMSVLQPVESEKDSTKNLPIDNVVSCLMDNCNVMRGKKTGVETLLRSKQPHLLDVHGDTIHIVSNAVKEFCKPFQSYLEDFALDIYCDYKLSPKATELFEEVCSLLHMEGGLRPLRPVSSRFLQMLAISERLHKIIDALIVFQYSFLQPSEQKTHKKKLEKIYKERSVTPAEQARLEEVRKLAKGCCTSKSDRKDRILLRLFRTPSQTRLYISVYRGILPKFQNFIKLYQSEKPMLHTLHVDMYHLTRDFLALFVKTDAMPKSFRVSALKKINCKDANIQVSDRNLTVGCHAYQKYQILLQSTNKPHWFQLFQQQLRTGYQNACVHLQTKLPLDNTTLSNLTALDPEMHGSESTVVDGFSALAKKLPNVISAEEAGVLYEEVRHYNSNEEIHAYLPSYQEQGKHIDQHWWHLVSQLERDGKKRYPLLNRLVSALLSIFSGPLVEGTFNIMDDIVENDRTSLTSENYEAIAVIKSGLHAEKKTSTTMDITHQMRTVCTNAYSTYRDYQQTSRHQKDALKRKRVEEALQKLNNATPKTDPVLNRAAPKNTSENKNKAKATPKTDPVLNRAAPKNTSQNKPKRFVIPKVCEPAPSMPTTTDTDTDRNLYFKSIAVQLEKASKQSFQHLQEVAERVEKDFDRWPVACVKGLLAHHYTRDDRAADLSPTDAPPLTPVVIQGDGNCLPRCTALLATGTEDGHVEMRARIIVELAANEQHYLEDSKLQEQYSGKVAPPKSWSELYASQSVQFGQEELNTEGIRQIFRKEVKNSTPSGSYMGPWQLHAVASVLHTTIQTLYPEYGDHEFRHYMQRLIGPRLPSSGSDRASKPPCIMWSRLWGKDVPKEMWEPNHFVVCLPESETERNQELKRKSSQSQIHEFFGKKPRH